MKPPAIMLLLSTGLFTACQVQPPASASRPAPRDAAATAAEAVVQWKGFMGGSKTAMVRVLRTPAEWDAFWAQAQREKPRPLDPLREMGLVVFLGERRTGGYSIEIVRVVPEDGKLVVAAREMAPAPEMMVTQALTTPWAAAIVPRSDLPAELRMLGASSGPRSK